MPRRLSELPVNPFEDDVVFEPREAEKPVAGLNQRPLDRLLMQFRQLEGEPPPRRLPRRLKAQLLVSPSAGYGKSHLIGRLFQALRDRAIQIYLRPFADPESCWRSILLKLVQELERPLDSQVSLGAVGAPTQLDALARGTFGQLLAGMLNTGRAVCDDDPALERKLQQDPIGTLGHGEAGITIWKWLQPNFQTVLDDFERGLHNTVATVRGRPSAWLKVLFAYASNPEDSNLRISALEWLKGESVGDKERERLGLIDEEVPDVEDSSVARNEAARLRIEDLCTLAGFHRPFLFCFDQTDMLTGKPKLAEKFGEVIESLATHGMNLMMVVTANAEPWNRDIINHMQKAHVARFSTPIELDGLTPEQGEALARQRLGGCGLETGELDAFLSRAWLDQIFRETKFFGVRDFLRLCAVRCAQLMENAADAGATVRVENTIDDYYNRYAREVRVNAPLLRFDPDLLQWSVGEELVGGALPGVMPAACEDRQIYFRVSWTGPKRVVLFAFEDSSHGKRWESILRESGRQFQHFEGQGVHARLVFFRTRDQRAVPGPGWKVLAPRFADAKDYVSVRVLSEDEHHTLAAAYELFVNVVEGNAPFTRDEALIFLRGKLQPWWRDLLGASGTPPVAPPLPPISQEVPDVLLADIRRIVKAKLFLSLDQLASDLSTEWARETVLAGCQAVREIRIFTTSQATALKWQS